MTAAELKRQLKSRSTVPEVLAIRLHRAISWLKCAEENEKNTDLQFMSLWISFNACYAVEGRADATLTEREMFVDFIQKLDACDTEGQFFQMLWKKFS